MSYTVYELRDSESGSVDTNVNEGSEVWNVTKHYVIGQCPGGMLEVKYAIVDYAPRYWQTETGYWRRTKLTIKGLGKAIFDVVAEYTTLTPTFNEKEREPPEDTRQFVPGSLAWDTTGNTEHITTAYGERVFGSDDTFSNAINVSGTSVQGIDRIVPGLKYSETWNMPTQVGVSVDYVKAVYTLTGSVNKTKFRAFEPGEALFTGARAQWQGDQPYVPVTFDFSIRANDPNYTVSPLGTTTKKGWELPWIVYESQTNGRGRLIQVPACVVIDTIYREKDWSSLLITNSEPGKKRVGTKAQDAATANFVNLADAWT